MGGEARQRKSVRVQGAEQIAEADLHLQPGADVAPPRSASKLRCIAGNRSPGASTRSPRPPQVSITFSKSGEGLSSVIGIALALTACPSGNTSSVALRTAPHVWLLATMVRVGRLSARPT